jgi:hypothetical protein
MTIAIVVGGTPMSKNWRVWSLAGVVGLAVAAAGFAATTPATTTTAKPTAAKATTAKPAAAKSTMASRMAAIGTVVSVDTGAGTLTVKASKGDESFTLGSSTKVLDSHGKTVSETDLAQGKKVKVYYTSKNGEKDASRVYVLSSGKSSSSHKH